MINVFTTYRSKNNKKRGFTLVEVLVSLFIFTLTILMGVTAVVSMDRTSKRNLAKDQAVQSAYFLLDSMSRSIRMGSNFKCINSARAEIACGEADAKGIEFINQSGRDESYILKSNQLFKKDGSEEKPMHDKYVLEFEYINFKILKSVLGATTIQQPVVSIRANAQYKSRGETYELPIQMSLTQRSLAIE